MMEKHDRICWLTLLALVCMTPQHAQEPSRAAEIQAAQDAKAAVLKPDRQDWLERLLLHLKEQRLLERFAGGVGGFRPRLGGMVQGGGFAAGPEYRKTALAGGRVALRASAQASLRGYRRYEFQTGVPKLASDRFFADFCAVRHDYPGLNYYGTGAESEKSGRAAFHLEDTALDATFGTRPAPLLSVGVSMGYVFHNIGPSTDSRFAFAELIYSPSQAPGIDQQANFLRTGTFAQYDWRDNPDGPRRGGNYFVQFSDYRDQTLGRHDFGRLDLEAQQYVSLLNQRRVLAFRAKSTLAFRDSRQVIPFYLQPTLGGSEDLRGYRPFRFRDENLFVANAEYRWEVFSGLDMALFADAGKVFARRSDFDLRHLESDVGFGFRFNAHNRTFLRLDIGFSHEGFQVWVKFNNIFRKGPVRTSSSMGDL